MAHPRRISVPHRVLSAVALLATVASVSACGKGTELGSGGLGGGSADPTTLIVSAAYVQASGPDGDVQGRLADLQASIDDLRDSTGSGWVGRQDDLTGYLSELSGGRYFGPQGASAPDVIASFLDQYGSSLFGVGSGDIDLGAATAATEAGSATIRGTQEISGVPVLDGVLTFTIGAAEDEPRLSAARGRVFPGLAVDTDPRVSQDRARRIAANLSGGSVQRDPRLVVLPGGEGQLTWEVPVAGVVQSGSQAALSDGLYYLSAATGDLVTIRPSSADASPLLPQSSSHSQRSAVGRVHGRLPVVSPLPRAMRLRAAGNSVAVSGQGPLGEDLTGFGEQTGQGVLLKDTTVPTYDAATGEGGIETFDARGSDDQSQLPGTPYVENGRTITDPDALAAQAYSRAVYDYYFDTYGRRSWDDQGASMISTVNFAGGDYCNAFFSFDLRQMIYGNPCEGPGGSGQLVTVDVTGHEITHGVTATTADLIYFGQSGALNESFSDYFGNVIGNAFKGTDDATEGEDLCTNVTEPQTLCSPTSEGVLAVRDLLNGSTFDDYLRLLSPGFRLQLLRSFTQDNGGVHLNSSIWNNALWSIRTRLAQIDGVPGNESALAQSFDHAVYAALTTQLGPTAGFVDARDAVEQSIVDQGADPTVLKTAREIFDFAKICAGCTETVSTPAVGVSTNAQTQVSPAVHGDRIAWIDLNSSSYVGTPAQASFDGSGAESGAAPDTAQIVYAGDAVVSLDSTGAVVRKASDGTTSTLATEDFVETAARGLAGSDDGAAWVSFDDNAVKYVDSVGDVTSGSLEEFGNDPVISIGAGNGMVAMGTDGGRLLSWKPGGRVTSIGHMDGAILSIAAYGDRLVAVDDSGAVALSDTAGGRTDLSTAGYPFGAAMNGDYAVWTNVVGTLGGSVAAERGLSIDDTDLYVYSFATGTIYDLIPTPGQQGFPALSGDRLVWQDSVNDGDDILTATIPSGL
ncbi:M4 family metallopeptidase [Nocardioides sp.]|uniref:M4 family metallopeptidase n=1 Tax=Nocardioides sp. TaxID=35761 RepID=UPI0031FF238D|nr:Thermolysin precursor [Nocardioides sp.]